MGKYLWFSNQGWNKGLKPSPSSQITDYKYLTSKSKWNTTKSSKTFGLTLAIVFRIDRTSEISLWCVDRRLRTFETCSRIFVWKQNNRKGQNFLLKDLFPHFVTLQINCYYCLPFIILTLPVHINACMYASTHTYDHSHTHTPTSRENKDNTLNKSKKSKGKREKCQEYDTLQAR